MAVRSKLTQSFSSFVLFDFKEWLVRKFRFYSPVEVKFAIERKSSFPESCQVASYIVGCHHWINRPSYINIIWSFSKHLNQRSLSDSCSMYALPANDCSVVGALFLMPWRHCIYLNMKRLWGAFQSDLRFGTQNK